MLIIQFINYIAQIFEGTNIDLTAVIQGFDTLSEVIGFISFFLPMQPVISCIGIVIATYGYRLLVSFFKMIWSVVPFL